MSFSFLDQIEFVPTSDKPKGKSVREQFIAKLDDQIKHFEEEANGREYVFTQGGKERTVRPWFRSKDKEVFVGDLRFGGMKIELPGQKQQSIRVAGGYAGIVMVLEAVKIDAMNGAFDTELGRLHAAIKARRAPVEAPAPKRRRVIRKV